MIAKVTKLKEFLNTRILVLVLGVFFTLHHDGAVSITEDDLLWGSCDNGCVRQIRHNLLIKRSSSKCKRIKVVLEISSSWIYLG